MHGKCLGWVQLDRYIDIYTEYAYNIFALIILLYCIGGATIGLILPVCTQFGLLLMNELLLSAPSSSHHRLQIPLKILDQQQMKEYGFIYAYDIDIIVSTFYIETLQNMFFCRLPTNILVG